MTAPPWRQVLRHVDRAWSSGKLPVWLLAGSAAVLTAGAAAALAVAQDRRQARQATHEALAEARASSASIPAVSTVPPSDFVASLGQPMPVTLVVEELQRASAAAGVLLASVQAAPRDVQPDQLGRIELLVVLRGPYPGAKLVLKQLIERFPNITVQRLRMRRVQTAADVETNVVLSAWSAPAAAGR